MLQICGTALEIVRQKETESGRHCLHTNGMDTTIIILQIAYHHLVRLRVAAADYDHIQQRDHSQRAAFGIVT